MARLAGPTLFGEDTKTTNESLSCVCSIEQVTLQTLQIYQQRKVFKKIHHIGVDIHKNHAGAKLAVFIDTSQILMKLAILRKFWVKIEK